MSLAASFAGSAPQSAEQLKTSARLTVDDHAASDCLGYNVRAGLLTKTGKQRRSIEYESQLLGVLAGGFRAPFGEQSIDHRPSREIAEQAAALLGHGAIRA